MPPWYTDRSDVALSRCSAVLSTLNLLPDEIELRLFRAPNSECKDIELVKVGKPMIRGSGLGHECGLQDTSFVWSRWFPNRDYTL